MLEVVFTVGTQRDAYRLGFRFIEEIQKQLSGDRTGRYYPAPGNKWYDDDAIQKAGNFYVKYTGTTNRHEIQGAAYRASAPGESPAVRSGRLRQSFVIIITPRTEYSFEVRVRSVLVYADDMEFGNTKVQARPFLNPVLQRMIPELVQARMQGIARIFGV